ncbi:hypothetical protein [Endozoicomonas ascidiicola]|uniref:hypothetical protein n=1 Tax=Endozoicomonas ascidiicola TaxID=1698521 RepID=UPI000AF1EA66|nr:hypothetical protein [Endozoicomonas ascidiicola]
MEFSTSMLSVPSDITGKVNSFFAQIINQSNKSKSSLSGTPLQTARSLLKSKLFIIDACQSLKGFLTHNPKIYDAKVRGRVFSLSVNSGTDSSYIYGDSVSYHHQYDWAGNAGYISKRYFLCTEFIYKGDNTTLYHEFLKESSELVEMLTGVIKSVQQSVIL